MTPLFQHLRQPETPPDDSGRRQLVHLMDLDRHTGAQSAPRMITDPVTGKRVLALHTLPAGQADVAPYDPDYPSSMTVTGGLTDEGVASRTRSVLGRLEEVFETPGQHLVNRPATGSRYEQTIVIGHAAGVVGAAPFSVMHLGGAGWRVSSGAISGGGMEQNSLTIEGDDVILPEGVIGFYVRLAPVYDSSAGGFIYRITPEGGLRGEESYTNNPPKRFLVQGENYTWTPGRMFIPLAYVCAPTRTTRPTVIHAAGGANITFPALYDVGLPTLS